MGEKERRTLKIARKDGWMSSEKINSRSLQDKMK